MALSLVSLRTSFRSYTSVLFINTISNETLEKYRHAHSDHYTNLSSSWKSGPIYCSEVTANLIIYMLSVDKKWIRPLPMDTPTIIPDTGGVQVTLIEANHCPGSCLFLFEGHQTVNAGDSTFRSTFVGSSRMFRYLHCGDFRASPRHITHPAMTGKKIDCVYLDTTYLNPRVSGNVDFYASKLDEVCMLVYIPSTTTCYIRLCGTLSSPSCGRAYHRQQDYEILVTLFTIFETHCRN